MELVIETLADRLPGTCMGTGELPYTASIYCRTFVCLSTLIIFKPLDGRTKGHSRQYAVSHHQNDHKT